MEIGRVFVSSCCFRSFEVIKNTESNVIKLCGDIVMGLIITRAVELVDSRRNFQLSELLVTFIMINESRSCDYNVH